VNQTICFFDKRIIACHHPTAGLQLPAFHRRLSIDQWARFGTAKRWGQA
jgi:hypothetical protein